MEEEKKKEIFKAGASIITEGELARKMYIVKSGKVRVYRSYFEKKITLAILGPGEVFGELSFFDAAPRSASVEAITDVTTRVYSGDKALNQIENLPKWVTKVLRTTFHRFREMDERITLLQSMADFQKKNTSTDTIAETIYTELIRYNKSMLMLYHEKIGGVGKESKAVHYKTFNKELGDMLGNKYISFRTYFKTLLEHNIIKEENSAGERYTYIDQEGLQDFTEYLEDEISCGRYLLLNGAAIEVLRKLVGFGDEESKVKGEECQFKIDKHYIENIPDYELGIKYLEKKKIIQVRGSKLLIECDKLHRHYIFQSIVKTFDHTIVHS